MNTFNDSYTREHQINELLALEPSNESVLIPGTSEFNSPFDTYMPINTSPIELPSFSFNEMVPNNEEFHGNEYTTPFPWESSTISLPSNDDTHTQTVETADPSPLGSQDHEQSNSDM